jgi:hypothetical protein
VIDRRLGDGRELPLEIALGAGAVGDQKGELRRLLAGDPEVRHPHPAELLQQVASLGVGVEHRAGRRDEALDPGPPASLDGPLQVGPDPVALPHRVARRALRHEELDGGGVGRAGRLRGRGPRGGDQHEAREPETSHAGPPDASPISRTRARARVSPGAR